MVIPALVRGSAIVAVAAALTACSAATSSQSPGRSLSEEPPPLVAAVSLPDNAVANAVAKLDDLADELMVSSGIPGMAVAVVHGGKTLYAKGFGVRDIRTREQVSASTVFQLASLSKPLAATVVAHQVGAGGIGWDTPVVDKLPWFALSDPAISSMVSVGDLFAHRSGLPDHAGDQLEDLGYSRHEILERLRLLPLDSFRTSYAYTNFGLTAAAEAVAAAAGESWESLCDRVLYRPLQMGSASSRFADYQGRENKAVGHVKTDDGYQPNYTRDPDAQSPAGGVSATVEDLTGWLEMVLGEGTYRGTEVVDRAALLAALTPQIVSSPPTQPAMRSGFYGYGFNVGTTSAGRVQLSHSGGFELGAASNVVIIPSADVAIVALTNASPVGVPETLTAQFADLVQFGDVREDWWKLYSQVFATMSAPVGELVGKPPPANPAPTPRPLLAYSGSYANPYWGAATVTEKDGWLTLAIGPRRTAYRLRHWDGDVFAFDLNNENAPPGSVSKASFDGDRLTLEYYDDDKMGTFTR